MYLIGDREVIFQSRLKYPRKQRGRDILDIHLALIQKKAELKHKQESMGSLNLSDYKFIYILTGSVQKLSPWNTEFQGDL